MTSRKPFVNALTEELSRSLQAGEPLSVEAMRVLVHAEKEGREKNTGPALNCCVVDLKKPNEFEVEMEKIMKHSLDLREAMRLQVIVKADAHYCVVDMKLSKDGNEFFILDAAGSTSSIFRLYGFLSGLKKIDGDSFFARGYLAAGKMPNENLQKDAYSCPAFALDHACQVSKIDGIYDILREHSKRDFVEWNNLPASLIWNAQSIAWLDCYKRSHAASNVALDEYLKIGEATRVVNGVEKKINHSINLAFKGYAEQALALIQKCADHSSIGRIAVTPSSIRFDTRLQLPKPEVDDTHQSEVPKKRM